MYERCRGEERLTAKESEPNFQDINGENSDSRSETYRNAVMPGLRSVAQSPQSAVIRHGMLLVDN